MARRKPVSARRAITSPPPPPLSQSVCAVSVIIAMYNTEKYVGECLDSLLAQTFTDFEVIVVDDCSTDNSCEIVENYIPKFNGRLKLTHTAKNSGSGGTPRNIGLGLARGEYVFFVDDDDTTTPTALAELYAIAKNFDADVVACEKYYDVPENLWHDAEFRRQLKPFSYQRGGFVDKPTLLGEDFAERVRDCEQKRFLWNLWSKLIRRDFMIANDIRMMSSVCQDMLCTCCLLYSAKKVVRVPNTVNYYRNRKNSITWRGKDGLDGVHKYLRTLRVGFAHLDKFLSGREFFQKNPHAKYTALNVYLQEILSYLNDIYAGTPIYNLDETLREELRNGDNVALTAFVFNMFNLQRLQFWRAQNQFKQFAAQTQRRIAELEAELQQLKTKE